MRLIKKLNTFTLLVLLMISCTSEDEFLIEETTVEVIDSIEIVDDLIAGKITDYNDGPIEGASVSLFNKNELLKIAITDETGYYEFNTEGLDDSQKLLTIEKEGFLTVRKVVVVGPGQVVSSKLSATICSFGSEDYSNPFLELDIPMVTISGLAYNVDEVGSENSRILLVNADFLDPGGVIEFSNVVAIQEDGSWESIVPRDMEMRLIVDNQKGCNEGFKLIVGPVTEDKQIEDIRDLATSFRQSVSLGLPVCNNENLDRGVMIHFFDGNLLPDHYQYDDGNIFDIFPDQFSQEIMVCQLVCDLSFLNSLLVYDYATNQYALEIRTFDEVIDFGKVETCSQLESNYDIKIAGETINVENANFTRKAEYIPTGQPIFSLNRLAHAFIGVIDISLSVRAELAENTTYTENVELKLSYFKEAKAFGNFEGSVTVTKIEDGYVYGEIDGIIYPSSQEWPHFFLSIDGPSESITGTFKSLLVN